MAESRSIMVAALGLPMPKLIMVMPSAVALGIGRSAQIVGADRPMPSATAEVGEQDMLAESVQGDAGVARQPVLDDLFLFLHPAIVGQPGRSPTPPAFLLHGSRSMDRHVHAVSDPRRSALIRGGNGSPAAQGMTIDTVRLRPC